MNESHEQSTRKLASAFIYYLIGDSKEFAKYVYEKIHKNFG
jgi:hypothetical protein